MRDLDKNPYSKDEQRVAKFFFDKGVGGGDDPIEALFASHEYLILQRRELRNLLESVLQIIKQEWEFKGAHPHRAALIRDIEAALK